MSADVQRYRVTFKCSEHGAFRKITKNPELKNAQCPDCRKEKLKASKITKFVRLGDGPVPSHEKQVDSVENKVYPNVIYKCKACTSVIKLYEKVGEPSLQECPACGSREIQYRGHISKDIPTESLVKTKAIDTTADIVMQDYHMTDLKDNVRMGETMAPKLNPRLQSAADSFFNKSAKRNLPINGAAIAKRAMSGALRDPRSYVDPVATLRPENKPKTHIVAGEGVGKA